MSVIPRPLAVPCIALAAIAVLCAGARGQGQGGLTSDDVAAVGIGKRKLIELQSRKAERGAPAPVSTRPLQLQLSAEPLANFSALPAFRCPRPLYFQVYVARSGRVNFALDKSDPAARYYDLLYVDRNCDRDLANDGEPMRAFTVHSEERGLDYADFVAAQVDAYYTEQVTLPVFFTLYAWYPPEGELDRIYCTAASWWQGQAKLEGRSVEIAIFDDDNDFLYEAETCTWSIVDIEEGGDLLGADSLRPASVPFRVGGIPYKIGEIAAEGNRMELLSETEHNAFNAEMEFDPTLTEPPRPVATKEVSWATDLDVALALAARDERRVFLVMSVPWSRYARRFDERTLLDAEVVSLLDSFVCVRANLDLDRELAARYAVDGCPTVLILDGAGNVVERIVGYREARILCETLRRHR
jgi:hypothetical protein